MLYLVVTALTGGLDATGVSCHARKCGSCRPCLIARYHLNKRIISNDIHHRHQSTFSAAFGLSFGLLPEGALVFLTGGP
ncbi:MAG: hypothetical protein AAGA03_12225, partial [Planctomycetota bacterium]